MAQYRVSITIRTENKAFVTGGGMFPSPPTWTRDHSLDAGTHVEVESSGDVCDVEAPHSDWLEDWDALTHLELDPLTNDLDPRCVFHLNRAGRNLVLLAVAGDRQVFDHWEGNACVDQGARCEVAEPEDVEGSGYDLTAVFKARPGQSHGQRVDPGGTSRLSNTLPDAPRR